MKQKTDCWNLKLPVTGQLKMMKEDLFTQAYIDLCELESDDCFYSNVQLQLLVLSTCLGIKKLSATETE